MLPRRISLMSRIALVVFLLTAIAAGTALAGVPVPPLCGCEVAGQAVTCQYRFVADGSMDTLEVHVTLRDVGGDPVPSCETSVTLVPAPGTQYFCSCCPNPQILFTNAGGVALFEFARLGGFGDLDVNVTAHVPTGDIPICSHTITFTSPDLNGSCDPFRSTTVVDLGLWAQCLPPAFCIQAAYVCGMPVGVVDLGVWASGLGKGCQSPNPNCPY
jgi:hypothetical protein